jgi:hypothetical protein
MTEKQTFDSVRWLASEALLHRGILERALATGDIDAIAADCGSDDLTDTQRATIKSVLEYAPTRDALLAYWAAYDKGRADGSIPDARATAANPWLD